MRCTRCEELLIESVDGRLDTANAERLRTHVSGCARCATLAALLKGSGGVPAPRRDLSEAILARTLGRASLPPRGVLQQLDRDLPWLAEMEPDARFLGDVLAATVKVDRRSRRARAAAFWRELVQRPRFALEGAYLGSLAVFLLLGWTGSPLSGVSAQVMAHLQHEGSAVGATVGAAVERIGVIGQGGWSRAGDVFSAAGAGIPGTPPEIRLAPFVAKSWRDAVTGLLRPAWQDVLEPAFDWIRRAWQITWGRATDSPFPEATANDHVSVST